MEISSSVDVQPISTLLTLLLLPKLAHFCAVFAYDGLRNGETLTHFGFRKGTIARIYGVFYGLFFILTIAMIPLFVKFLLEIGRAKIVQALLFAVPIPALGFVLIGMATGMAILWEGIVRVYRKKIPKNPPANKLLYLHVLFLLSIGVQSLIGLPQWVLVGIFAFFIYLTPMESPKALKEAHSFRSAEVQFR